VGRRLAGSAVRRHVTQPGPEGSSAGGRVQARYRAILALQRAAGNGAVSSLLAVQRDDRGAAAAKDVVMVLSPASERADALAEAAVIAPDAQILYATSPKEMASQLKALKVPVKTLFFFGHSTADGDIVFETPSKRTFVRAETIAQTLKGVVQVESVDFHGCSVAVSPGEMDKVRKAVKAKKALGSSCELVRQVAGPVKAPGERPITDRASFDLSKPANRKLFDTGLARLRDLFKDDRKKCIINDSEEGYFKAHGKLVAVWVNPESIAGNDAFDKDKSVCFGALTHERVDPSKNPVIDENKCRIIELQ
jgi:hypothetical protein